jgi:hypothetical protein
MDTVVQDNMNPIEKVERSSLIVSSVVHAQPPLELVRHNQLDRVRQFSPALFPSSGKKAIQ